jgi:predicted nucleic acid-binding protein
LTDYLLDTNVVSELVRPNRCQCLRVGRAQDETRFYLSVLTFGEVRGGIEQLPQARAANGCGSGWKSIWRIASKGASSTSTAR